MSIFGRQRSIVHILILTDNFPPEVNAPASRTFEHARAWVRAGHRVTVITGAPNFPQGRVYPGYKNRWFYAVRMDGIRVIRVKTFIHANEGFLLRSLDYLSFMVAAIIGSFAVTRFDVVLATSPQFFTAVAGWVVGMLRGRPFVFEVRDLWPASIVAVGALGGSPLLVWLERLELLLYRRARAVVTVTRSFRADLVRRDIPATKVTVVTNGADLTAWSPRPRDQALAHQHGLANALVIGYLGTHGLAHALHRVLDAAESLRERTDIRFLLLGDGAVRAELKTHAQARGLSNIVFVDPQPKAVMAAWWSLCDVALIHLKNDPVFATVIPSKLFEAMAMGVPVLYVGPDGEAPGLVRTIGCGITVPPEDTAALVAAIHALSDNPDHRARHAAAGLRGVHAFRRDVLAAHLLRLLVRVARGACERSGGHGLQPSISSGIS